MSDQIVLSYGDSVIRQSDVNIVTSDLWINDTLISFWFEYLSEKFCKDRPDVIFVSASVTQLIKLMEYPEISMFVDPLDLPSKDLIFFPVNDYLDFEVNGGSHWSLLLYCKTKNMWYHYDSMFLGNIEHAKILKKKIGRFLNHDSSVSFNEANTSTQSNAFDCGMFTMAFAEAIIIDSGRDLASCILDKEKIRTMRKELVDVIYQLRDRK